MIVSGMRRLTILHLCAGVLCLGVSAPARGQEEQPSAEELLRQLQSLQERMQQLEDQLESQRQSEESAQREAQPAPEAEPDAEQADQPTASSDQVQESTVTGVTAGFDKSAYNPFFVKTEDDKFRLNVGGYTQIRYAMNWRTDAPSDEDDFTRDAAVQRTRFFIGGNYTEAFDYMIRLNINDGGELDLHSAWGQWNFADDMNVRFGLFGEAMSREDWANPQDVLSMEYSNNDFTFGLGSQIGAQLHSSGEKERWWAGVSNGAFGTQDQFGNFDANDLLVTTRWERQLSGTDWSNWSDLIGRPGRPTGTLLGLAGGYQLNQKNNDNPKHAFQAIADLSFAGDGYHAMIAGTLQPVEARDTGWEYTFGVLAQAGVFVMEKVQVYGRYEFISPGDLPGDLDDFNTFAAGVNFLPFDWTNRWKFTAEVQYLADGINTTIVDPSSGLGWLASDDDQWALRFQAQLGF